MPNANPIWANSTTIQRITGLTHANIRELARRGTIASRKIGRTMQSKTLYRVKDVLDWIEEGCE